MRALLIGITLLLCAPQASQATGQSTAAPAVVASQDRILLNLSRQKWLWMADRNIAELDQLFHDQSVFVHMGRTLSKQEEVEVIRSGNIQYKKAEIAEASVKFFGDTAILLNKIRLTAVVGGNEVINPFVVTEVYVRQDGSWKLGSMSFTRTVEA